MRFYRLIIIAALCIFQHTAFAAGYIYNYNAPCRKAYQYYMSLQVAQGNEVIKQELAANPGNLTAVYIANYGDCLQLLLNGNKKDYEQMRPRMDKRLELLQDGDKASPWQRLLEGGLQMHKAFVCIRMGEKISAATHFRKSFLLLKENRKKFPDFDYNNIFFGLEEAVIGTLPDDYTWIASVFGMKGSVVKGVGKLEAFVNSHREEDFLYMDAVIFYTYTKFYLQSKDAAWRYIAGKGFPDNNLLVAYVKTDIALNYSKNDIALQNARIMQSYPEYKQYPLLEYVAGIGLLRRLDDAAIGYFRHFLSVYRGNFHIKDAWQKLAYSYYLNGDMMRANECKARILTQGGTDIDGDKQALRFAKGDKWPHKVLLEARLLSDGGYYSRALARLGAYQESSFTDEADRAEYNYRTGKAYQDIGEDEKAMMYYKRTIAIARERKEQFAARASLQAGLLYEAKRNRTLALEYFRDCLAMPVQDFKNSIRQQAKAGINRLGGD